MSGDFANLRRTFTLMHGFYFDFILGFNSKHRHGMTLSKLCSSYEMKLGVSVLFIPYFVTTEVIHARRKAGQSSSLYFTAVLWSTHRLVRYKCSHSLRMTSYCRVLLKARLLNKTSHPIYPSPPSCFLLCSLPLIPSVSLQFVFLCSFTLLLMCINHLSPSPFITVQLFICTCHPCHCRASLFSPALPRFHSSVCWH